MSGNTSQSLRYVARRILCRRNGAIAINTAQTHSDSGRVRREGHGSIANPRDGALCWRGRGGTRRDRLAVNMGAGQELNLLPVEARSSRLALASQEVVERWRCRVHLLHAGTGQCSWGTENYQRSHWQKEGLVRPPSLPPGLR